MAGCNLVKNLEGSTQRLLHSGITCDSRKIRPGGTFFALPGANNQGSDFISDAITRGCCKVVLERDAFEKNRHQFSLNSKAVEVVVVDNIHREFVKALRSSLQIASHPTFAVTGTNGKTTIAYLIRHLMDMSTALIGTIEYNLLTSVLPSRQTTPDLESLYRMIASLPRDAALAIELSSHALDQRRAYDLEVDAAIFSNLTSDHMDYHGSQEAYFIAKRRLFSGENGRNPRKNIINIGDNFGRKLFHGFGGISYGVEVLEADYCASELQFSNTGTNFRLKCKGMIMDVDTPLLGEFNVENILAAVAAVHESRDIELEILCKKLQNFYGAPGRLESIRNDFGMTILIDFAHTEDGLCKVLNLLEKIKRRKILTVFGCGGNRDKTKRPKMMNVACALSDLVIATSDNPRGEDIEAIFHDMSAGITTPSEVIFERDRARAIGMAIKYAQEGDIILIAGKGHETYQQIGDQVLPFSDQSCVLEGLRKRKVRENSENGFDL